MTLSEFFGKFKSRSLWGNLAAMAVTVLLLGAGFKFGLDIYTHHGESIAIPKLMYKNIDQAQDIADRLNLNIEVVDTGYVKHLPPGCILEQSPEPGERVKSGHMIYVTINAASTPTLTLPDVIDNSSLREAMAKLTAMGFKLGPPRFIAGEKDWVYGILVNGRHVSFGDKVPVDATLVIQVGNGMRDLNDSVDYVDPVYEEGNDFEEGGETDDFKEVTAPPSDPTAPPAEPEPEHKPASNP